MYLHTLKTSQASVSIHKQYTYIKLEDTSEEHFFSSGVDNVGDITNQTVEMEQEYIST